MEYEEEPQKKNEPESPTKKAQQTLLNQTLGRDPDSDDKLDPFRNQIEEDEPYPLMLLHSKYLHEGTQYLKVEPQVYLRLCALTNSLLVKKIYTRLFWIYYCMKYQDDSSFFIKQVLRDKLKRHYMKLFIMTNQPKDEVFDILPFLLGQAIRLTLLEKV